MKFKVIINDKAKGRRVLITEMVFTKPIFAVKHGGFAVYNLFDKYKGGLGIQLGYTLKNGLRTVFHLSNEWLKRIDYSETVKHTVFTISVGKTF